MTKNNSRRKAKSSEKKTIRAKKSSPPSEFSTVFARLRQILATNAPGFTTAPASPTQFGLVGPAGPATLQAWGGKRKSESVPVAWINLGKAYVSYHLMGLYGAPALGDGLSARLKQRRQGKTCFNFTSVDEPLFAELAELTARCCQGMKRAGFIL